MPRSSDILLTFKEHQRPVARTIARALRSLGMRPWLDEYREAGGKQREAREEPLREVLAALVLVDEAGGGPWEATGIHGRLTELVERRVPLILVLLPGASLDATLPLFLGDPEWVDLRAGVSEMTIRELVVRTDRARLQTRRRLLERGTPTHLSRLPPLIDNLPPEPVEPLARLFVGRELELESLRVALVPNVINFEVSAGRALLLQDSGGVGKTTLALEYARRHADYYEALFFVRAESREILTSQLARLAESDVLGLPERDAPAEEVAASAVLGWLRGHERCLLILDGVDEDHATRAVTEMLPRLSGQVIITSRSAAWPASLPSRRLLPIPLADGARFLLARTAGRRQESDRDEEYASGLANALGCLPLALVQAGAAIAYEQTSLQAYLMAWVRRVANFEVVDPYRNPVALGWQQELVSLGATSRAILGLAAHLGPEPIPTSVFDFSPEILDQAGTLFGSAMAARVARGTQPVTEALSELAGYSIITLEHSRSFSVHPLIQEVIRGRVRSEDRPGRLELALRMVAKFASVDLKSATASPTWEMLRPHASRMLAEAVNISLSVPGIKGTASLAGNLALFLQAKNRHKDAIPWLRAALRFARSIGDENDPWILGYFKYLAGAVTELRKASVSANTQELTSQAVNEDSVAHIRESNFQGALERPDRFLDFWSTAMGEESSQPSDRVLDIAGHSVAQQESRQTSPARVVNAWFEGSEPPLAVDVEYTIGFKIGQRHLQAVASDIFREPDFGERGSVPLRVLLWAPGAEVAPAAHIVNLPASGDADPVHFRLTPRVEAQLELRFLIFLEREATLLQELRVSVMVGSDLSPVPEGGGEAAREVLAEEAAGL